jgi:hypothetical protein
MEQKIGRIREGHFPPHSRGFAPRSSCYRNSSPPAFKRPTCPELCSPSALFWEEGLRTIPLGSSTWWRAAAFHLTVFLPAAPRLPETPRYGERQFAFLPRPTQSEREQSQVPNQLFFRQTLPQSPQSWQRPFFALLLSDPCHVPSRAQATTFLLTCPLASDTLRGGRNVRNLMIMLGEFGDGPRGGLSGAGRKAPKLHVLDHPFSKEADSRPPCTSI